MFLDLNDGILALKELMDIMGTEKEVDKKKEKLNIYEFLKIINSYDDEDYDFEDEIDNESLMKLAKIALDNEQILINMYIDYLMGDK